MGTAMHRVKGIVALFLAVCLIPVVTGTAPAADDVEMEKMVVTGERDDTTFEVPSSTVEVITEEEIADLPVQNLQELLELKAGITTYSPQGMGIVTPPDVKMRGAFGVKRTVVEVDGQQWNNPWTGYWYFSQIPIEAIERMEIVLGPFEARFGEATGGVIRIFTKNGSDTENGMVAAEARTGDYGRTILTEQGAIHVDQFSAYASHNFYESANWRLNSRDYISSDLARTKADHNRFHVHTLYDMDELDLHLTGGQFDNNTQYGVSRVSGVIQDNNVSHWYVNGFGQWTPNEAWTVSFGLNNLATYHEFHGEVSRSGTQFTMTNHRDESEMNRFSAYADAAWTIDENRALSFGLQADNESSRKGVYDDDNDVLMGTVNGRTSDEWSGSEMQYGLWGQYNAFMLDRALELVLGLRYDRYERLDDDGGLSPKASLTWHYDAAGRVRLSLAHTYRSPSLSERYSPLWALSTSPPPFGINVQAVLYQGNEDVRAETTDSIELGIENEWLDGELVTRLTPYFVSGRNWIETKSDGGFPATTIIPTNIDDVEIHAVETAVEWRPFNGLMLFANHQWQEAYEIEDERERLLNYPYHLVKLGGTYHDNVLDDLFGLRLGLVMKHQADFATNTMSGRSPHTVAGLTTVDGRAGLEFFDGVLTVGVEGYNLFDERENTEDIETWTQQRNFLYGIGVNWSF